jgi:hypothetical protein
MYGIVKCLPTSRRNSISPYPPSQSRLLTISAGFEPAEKSRNGSSWAWIRSALARSVSSSSRFRSEERPDGSPIIPVPPPTSATGRPPRRWKWSSPKIGTRLPMWSDGPDGSKPL